MIKYLILLLLALIVFPIVILFAKKIELKTKLMFLIGGGIIALLGLLVQSTLSFYYSWLMMIGMIFVGAVLLTKQLEKQKLDEEESLSFVSQPIQPINEKPIQAQVKAKPITTPVAEIKNDDWLKPAKKES
jgi:hypothetical protein